MDRVSFFMIYTTFFGLLVNFAAAQTVHVVGDSMGWNIPPNTSVSYSSWASGKTFMVGDILGFPQIPPYILYISHVFNFMTNQHDVVQVPKASYDDCSDDDAIGNVITTGPANITLDSAGDRYYICSIGRHCESGQKLFITVASSSNPGAPAPPMTTPPATPTTPSPATPQPDACAPAPNAHAPKAGGAPPPAGLTPPPRDSASVSLTSSFLLVIISAGALAFIF